MYLREYKDIKPACSQEAVWSIHVKGNNVAHLQAQSAGQKAREQNGQGRNWWDSFLISLSITA